MTKTFTRAEARPYLGKNARETAGDATAQDEIETQGNPYPVKRLDKLKAATRHALVQGIGMDEGTVAAIVGEPGAGKTAFSISLAMSFAAAKSSWLGRKIMPGPVCYFAAEAPGSVTMRAKAAAIRAACERGPIYICKAVPSLGGEGTSDVDAERIIATVRRVALKARKPVKLIFLDTVASIMGDGDENSDGMMRLVAAAKRIALATGACVVLIHHPSKSDPKGLRGHGSLKAACDAVIRIAIEDALTGVRVATLMKARDDPSGLQLRFELEVVPLKELDSWGDPQTTVVVKLSSQAKPHPQPKGKQQQRLLVELDRRYLTGETSWDETTIRKAAVALEISRSSASAALVGLRAAGYLVVGSAPTHLRLKYPPVAADPK
jgi:putative DNA primase/helicase